MTIISIEQHMCQVKEFTQIYRFLEDLQQIDRKERADSLVASC
ncbi:hypothetical protein Hanom_Chr03g00238761 [Helianthus anomalus]